MTDIWAFLNEQLAKNEFLAGGFLLGAMATVVAYLRRWPIQIWNWLVRRFTIEVDIPDRDEAFIWVDKWLSAHTYSRNWARDLTVKTERPNSITDEDDGEPVVRSNQQPRIILSPAPGRHLFFFKRRLVSLYRERKDGAEENKISFGIRESFVLRIFARNRHIATQLLEEARELVHPVEQRKVTILTEQYCDWAPTTHQRIRPIESVILPKGKMEKIVAMIEDFQQKEEWYFERGIPWRLGMLLFGPPGSGKSSTVLAVASHFGLDIAMLNLNGFGSNDEQLRRMMSKLPPNTIVLLEDVDCLGIGRKSQKGEKISFSGFLNAIDGVAASEGRILFMTTNHIEKLDDALIRPGRADIKMEIGPPCSDQKLRLFKRFYPQATDEQTYRFLEVCKLDSMAGIQGHLLKNPTPVLAIQSCTNSSKEVVST